MLLPLGLTLHHSLLTKGSPKQLSGTIAVLVSSFCALPDLKQACYNMLHIINLKC